MYAADFEYRSAHSYDEAVGLLERYGEDAKILAGGQSLVPMMQLRLALPTHVVDVSDIPAPPVQEEGDTLVIPAGMRHARLLDDPVVARGAPMIAEAAQHIGNGRVRNRGTIGGSLAHADPAAELPCVATAIDARLVVRSSAGEREIGADEFFVSYFTTALAEAEVLTGIRVPRRRPRVGQAFVEYSRRASDFAVVEAAAVVELDRRGRCVAAALVFGGVAERPLDRRGDLRPALVGREGSESECAQAAAAAADGIDPPDDVHASAALRRRLARHLGAEALARAFRRAAG